jgi:hypothetical protein
MDSMLFAFPEERQKASSLLQADFYFRASRISFHSFIWEE